MIVGLSIILIITSLVMILLVLLHKGKGGGLSDLFGGGVTSTLGSSSVVERNLDRITIFFGVLWFIVHYCPRLADQSLACTSIPHRSYPASKFWLHSSMAFKGVICE